MDIVDLVNDFIDNRKTEKSTVHINSSENNSENNSENITEDIEAQRSNKIEPINNKNANLDYYVELLNQGVDPSKIEKHFNLTYGKLEELLLSNNYKFYSFMNFWSTLDEDQLCHDLVTQLNNGNTIYDLSGKYLRGNKERLRFVSMVEKLLDKYHFKFNSSLKVWNVSDLSNKKGLPLIVDELNSGKPLKVVAKMFEVTPASLRLSLKNANYRHDPLFKVWTLKTRKELVEQLARDLECGKTTLNELKLKDYNVKVLEIELKYFVNTNQKPYKQGLSNESSDNLIEHKDLTLNKLEQNEEPITSKSTNSQENNNSKRNENEITPQQLHLSEDEIRVVKEMITFWRQEKETDIQRKEVHIFMDSVLLGKLNKRCELEGLSKSKIIEKALSAYLND